jgi:hypothetical protein
MVFEWQEMWVHPATELAEFSTALNTAKCLPETIPSICNHTKMGYNKQ